MAYKDPRALAQALNPSHAIWVQTPKDEWKLWGGHDSGDYRTIDKDAFLQKGYKGVRLTPNGENWDYQDNNPFIEGRRFRFNTKNPEEGGPYTIDKVIGNSVYYLNDNGTHHLYDKRKYETEPDFFKWED